MVNIYKVRPSKTARQKSGETGLSLYPTNVAGTHRECRCDIFHTNISEKVISTLSSEKDLRHKRLQNPFDRRQREQRGRGAAHIGEIGHGQKVAVRLGDDDYPVVAKSSAMVAAIVVARMVVMFVPDAIPFETGEHVARMVMMREQHDALCHKTQKTKDFHPPVPSQILHTQM